MVHRLACGAEFGVGTEPVSGIWVTVEAGKIGRGDFQANAVAFAEDVAGDADFYFVLVDFIRF